MAGGKNIGKNILLVSVISLAGILVCFAAGMLISLPARAAELFGPPSPSLSPGKLYSQSLILVLSRDQLFQPIISPSSGFTFPIESGDNLDQVLSSLVKLGLVEHGRAFRAYLIYTGIDTRIQPGEYQFETGITELEIANHLGDPLSATTTLVILPGWRAEEIAASLAQSGLSLSGDEFLQAVRSAGKEGYLFPGSYQVDRQIPADQLVGVLYQGFLDQLSPELESGFVNQGLDLQQAVILASIIEREAVNAEEMPLIASVFLNRLRAEIPLAADPTVQYALGYDSQAATWWSNPLSLEDLEFQSPYNTYLNHGLPPGPICNPGSLALRAAADPAQTDYLYFRAACDGSGNHSFARTYEEHLANACP